MSARVAVCLLAVVCLAATKPSYAESSSGYLKVLWIDEEDGEKGIVFVGEILNEHPKLYASYPDVIISIKKDGILINLVEARCGERIPPGATCKFSAKTKYTGEEYDSISARVEEASLFMPNPDPDLLVGDVVLVEESLNIRSAEDGSIFVFRRTSQRDQCDC